MEVASALNSSNVLSPTGIAYSGKLIWATVKKYQKKLQSKELLHTTILDLSCVAVNNYGGWFCKEISVRDKISYLKVMKKTSSYTLD